MTFLGLFLFVVGIIMLVILVYIPSMISYYRSIYQEEKEIAQKCDLPKEIEQAILKLIKWKKNYMRNFIIFQIVHRSAGFASVAFSVLGLVAVAFRNSGDSELFYVDKGLEYSISFFSIMFVIFALYLSPSTRLRQYLEAWKECEKKYNSSMAKYGVYSYWQKQRNFALKKTVEPDLNHESPRKNQKTGNNANDVYCVEKGMEENCSDFVEKNCGTETNKETDYKTNEEKWNDIISKEATNITSVLQQAEAILTAEGD